MILYDKLKNPITKGKNRVFGSATGFPENTVVFAPTLRVKGSNPFGYAMKKVTFVYRQR